MSNYEHKPGSGTAFKNENYTKEGNQPYARGQVKLPSGEMMDIALWIPKSDKIKGFNVTIKEPYNPNNNTESQPEDDLPF